MVCFLPKSWLWMVKHHQRIILVPSTITDTKVNYWSKIIPKTHEFYWLADFNWTHQPCYSKIRSSRPNSIERSLNSHIIFDITPTFDIKLYTPLFLKSREKDYTHPLINRRRILNSEMRLDLGIFWLFDIFYFDFTVWMLIKVTLKTWSFQGFNPLSHPYLIYCIFCEWSGKLALVEWSRQGWTIDPHQFVFRFQVN